MMTKPELVSKVFSLVPVGLLILCSGNALGAIIYIPDKYPTIQQAIDASFEGDTLIVRDGTYLLSTALDFKGKAITVISQNGASNCILDGRNLIRVAYFHSGETSKSILSGFTIQNGKAAAGAAIYCEESSPTITQCTMRRNNAVAEAAYGGAIFLKSSSAWITYCQISDNKVAASSNGFGGGIFSSSSSPNILNSMISGNNVDTSWSFGHHSAGGGAYFEGGSPVISGVSIFGNSATAQLPWPNSYGGGIFFQSSSPSISNSIIRNNSSSGGGNSWGGGVFATLSFLSADNLIINGNSSDRGAGIYLNASSGSFTNCTVARNVAVVEGGGLFCAGSSPQVINCILWEDSPSEIVKTGTGNPAVTYSDVQGGYTGAGNVNSNPLFVNIAGKDFHLKSNSPCINIGNNSAPYLPSGDMDGNSRIYNNVVDMGAYEYQGCPLPGAVGLVSPFGAETTASPTYTWNMDPNATYYFLWVDDSTGNKVKLWYASTQANCNSSTRLCSVTPQVALAVGVVRWWIQTWNTCGYGSWSSAATFTAGALPGAAILVSPKGPNISTTPTYTWNAVPSATYYLLLVKDYTGFPRIQTWYSPTQLGCAAGTGTCSVKPATTLLPGDAIWWVQTYNSNGYGPWSDEMNFTVTGAAAPGKAVLMSPSGSITTASPTFKWNAVSSAAWYFLYVQDATAFWGRVTSWFPASQAGCASGTGTCSITPDTVLAPGAATWWIRTWSDLGTGPWSDGMSFTVPSPSAASVHTP